MSVNIEELDIIWQPQIMLVQDLSIIVFYLKSLSNTQSYLNYTHVYLYLIHANSLTNNTNFGAPNTKKGWVVFF